MSFGRNINEKTNFKHPAYPLHVTDVSADNGICGGQ